MPMLWLGVIRTEAFLCSPVKAFRHSVEPVCLSKASAEALCIISSFAFLLAAVFKAAMVYAL